MSWSAIGSVHPSAGSIHLYAAQRHHRYLTRHWEIHFTLSFAAVNEFERWHRTRFPAASAGEAQQLLQGQMARVVNKLAEAYEVQPGEILVCRETDPGWTALFGLAAGLVLDTFAGGMLSHAAIVAREYQLPTVVRAEGILASVRTGQVLAIDGTTGAVALVQR